MTLNLDYLKQIAEAATQGPWHWSGNTSNGEPYLATWIPGAGRCQILAIGGEDRTPSSPGAESLRSYLRESGDYDEETIEAEVHTWMHDSYGNVVEDPRLQFVTDLMCVNARELAVYEVARNQGLPDDTLATDPRIYRHDVVDINHPDAKHIAAFDPPTVLALITRIEELEAEKAAAWLIANMSPLSLASAKEITAGVTAMTTDRAAIQRVRDVHRPIRVYDECQHDADHGCEIVELADYTGCNESVIGWACDHCCYGNGGEWPKEECPHGGDHGGTPKSESCPTIQALEGDPE